MFNKIIHTVSVFFVCTTIFLIGASGCISSTDQKERTGDEEEYVVTYAFRYEDRIDDEYTYKFYENRELGLCVDNTKDYHVLYAYDILTGKNTREIICVKEIIIVRRYSKNFREFKEKD